MTFYDAPGELWFNGTICNLRIAVHQDGRFIICGWAQRIVVTGLATPKLVPMSYDASAHEKRLRSG